MSACPPACGCGVYSVVDAAACDSWSCVARQRQCPRRLSARGLHWRPHSRARVGRPRLALRRAATGRSCPLPRQLVAPGRGGPSASVLGALQWLLMAHDTCLQTSSAMLRHGSGSQLIAISGFENGDIMVCAGGCWVLANGWHPGVHRRVQQPAAVEGPVPVLRSLQRCGVSARWRGAALLIPG